MATIAAGQVEKVLGSNTFQYALLAAGGVTVYLFWDEISALWKLKDTLDPVVEPLIDGIGDTAQFMAGGWLDTETKAIKLLQDPDPIAQLRFLNDMNDSDNYIESSIGKVSTFLPDPSGDLADTAAKASAFMDRTEADDPLLARYLKKWPRAFDYRTVLVDGTMTTAKIQGQPYDSVIYEFLNAYPTQFPPLSTTASPGPDGDIYFSVFAPDDNGKLFKIGELGYGWGTLGYNLLFNRISDGNFDKVVDVHDRATALMSLITLNFLKPSFFNSQGGRDFLAANNVGVDTTTGNFYDVDKLAASLEVLAPIANNYGNLASATVGSLTSASATVTKAYDSLAAGLTSAFTF